MLGFLKRHSGMMGCVTYVHCCTGVLFRFGQLRLPRGEVRVVRSMVGFMGKHGCARKAQV